MPEGSNMLGCQNERLSEELTPREGIGNPFRL